MHDALHSLVIDCRMLLTLFFIQPFANLAAARYTFVLACGTAGSVRSALRSLLLAGLALVCAMRNIHSVKP